MTENRLTHRNSDSPGRLHQVARILNVPVDFFFDSGGAGAADPAAARGTIDLSTLEGVQLNLAFARIEDARLRRHIVALIQVLSAR